MKIQDPRAALHSSTESTQFTRKNRLYSIFSTVWQAYAADPAPENALKVIRLRAGKVNHLHNVKRQFDDKRNRSNFRNRLRHCSHSV